MISTVHSFWKKMTAAMLCGLFAFFSNQSKAQETFGHTINIGLGGAYYGYMGHSVPYLTANYEFDVANNFTLAPFIGLASYRSADGYDWHGRRYYYHQTIMPIGVKGVYYLDKLLGLNSKWDIYVGASLGFVFSKSTWDNGYYGGALANDVSPLFLDGHLGAEYHLNKKAGLFLDLSSGVSTIGLAIHTAGSASKASGKSHK